MSAMDRAIASLLSASATVAPAAPAVKVAKARAPRAPKAPKAKAPRVVNDLGTFGTYRPEQRNVTPGWVPGGAAAMMHKVSRFVGLSEALLRIAEGEALRLEDEAAIALETARELREVSPSQATELEAEAALYEAKAAIERLRIASITRLVKEGNVALLERMADAYEALMAPQEEVVGCDLGSFGGAVRSESGAVEEVAGEVPASLELSDWDRFVKRSLDFLPEDWGKEQVVIDSTIRQIPR